MTQEEMVRGARYFGLCAGLGLAGGALLLVAVLLGANPGWAFVAEIGAVPAVGSLLTGGMLALNEGRRLARAGAAGGEAPVPLLPVAGFLVIGAVFAALLLPAVL